MEYAKLNNGVLLPMVGYGTWDVRGEKGKESILTAIDVGYRLLDTAQMYENEKIVGQAAKESTLPREEIFITTKLYRPCISPQHPPCLLQHSSQDGRDSWHR